MRRRHQQSAQRVRGPSPRRCVLLVPTRGAAATSLSASRVASLVNFETRVADVAQPQLLILLQAATQQAPDAARRLGGQPMPIGRRTSAHRRASRSPCRLQTRDAQPASRRGRHPNAHTSEPRSASPADRLLWRHVRGRPQNRSERRRHESSGIRTDPWPSPAAARAFARPKSSTFTLPSGRILMFAGFRSR